MSIATEIQALTENTAELSTCRGDIRTALEGKGVSASTHDFSDFASDIDAIPSGGGGGGDDFEIISATSGKLKKHLAAYSIDSLSLLPSFPALRNYLYFLPCKSTDNTTLDRVYLTNYAAQTAWDYSSVFSKRQMSPIATADDKQSYDVNDYQINPAGTTTFTASRTIGADYVSEAFTITVTNSTAEDITVKCIRFEKFLQGLQSSGSTSKYVLLYSYYLDTPITVTANGGTQQITIELRKTVGS